MYWMHLSWDSRWWDEEGFSRSVYIVFYKSIYLYSSYECLTLSLSRMCMMHWMFTYSFIPQPCQGKVLTHWRGPDSAFKVSRPLPPDIRGPPPGKSAMRILFLLTFFNRCWHGFSGCRSGQRPGTYASPEKVCIQTIHMSGAVDYMQIFSFMSSWCVWQ